MTSQLMSDTAILGMVFTGLNILIFLFLVILALRFVKAHEAMAITMSASLRFQKETAHALNKLAENSRPKGETRL